MKYSVVSGIVMVVVFVMTNNNDAQMSQKDAAASANALPNINPDNTGGRTVRLSQEGIVGQRVSGFLPITDAEEMERKHDIEYPGMRHRLPQAVVIGASKCGTEALEFFLQLHPDIATDVYEVNFFASDKFYNMGYNWFRKQMPAASGNQLTMQRGTAYFDTLGVPERIQAMNETVKLILSVCNPTRRIMSWYKHMVVHAPPQNKKVEPFNKTFFQPDKNGKLQIMAGNRAIRSGHYANTLREWLKIFPREQIHIVNGNQLTADPIVELRKVVGFLGLRQKITENDITFNSTKGFYCKFIDGQEQCLSESKGRTQVPVPSEYVDLLKKYFEPKNREFFSLINEELNWDVPLRKVDQ